MAEKKRESSIELLRIIAMFMIVAYHAATNSILYDNSILELGSFQNRLSIAALFPFGRIGVMLFFMITGYFLCGKTKRNCLGVIIKTCFYALFTVVIFLILKILIKLPIHNYGGGRTALQFFIPISSGVIWFTTSYIFLMLLLPIVNGFLNKLNFKGFIIFLCLFNFIPFGLGNLLGVTYSRMYEALFFYSCGVFYKNFFLNPPKKILSLFSALIFYFSAFGLSYIYILLLLKSSRFAMFVPFFIDCICVPMICFGVFAIFISLKIGNISIINTIASTTLAVYLIHGSVFQMVLWENIFQVKEVYQESYFPIAILGMAGIVFIVSSLIDICLDRILFPYLNNLFNKVTDKIKQKYMETNC